MRKLEAYSTVYNVPITQGMIEQFGNVLVALVQMEEVTDAEAIRTAEEIEEVVLGKNPIASCLGMLLEIESIVRRISFSEENAVGLRLALAQTLVSQGHPR
ncbi:hypothetical protein ACEUZ9_000468 [Paracoccus litorisediminis]|uniref:hypothetical protein n=1 Tax=Paracoccus litorisediminis TaxID=2006130 RepID=UPI00372FCA35